MRVILGTVLVSAAALAACGGSGQSSAPQSPAGVWGFTNDPAIPRAIINSAGRAIFITSDGEIFSGTAEVAGTDLTIAVEGYPSLGSTFSDGSSHGTGVVTGTVTTGDALSATLTFTTDSGTAITADWTLPYYAFDESSSLSDISPVSGFSVGGGPATSIYIDPNGVMSSQSASNGCVLSGSVSTNDPEHNVYDVSYSYSNCGGALQGLNGLQFTGLAFNSTNDVPGNLAPLKFIMAVSGDSATAKYGISSNLIVAGF